MDGAGIFIIPAPFCVIIAKLEKIYLEEVVYE